jgi:hypothetical protein
MESSEQDSQRRALLVCLIDEISSNKIASSRVQNGNEQDENIRDAETMSIHYSAIANGSAAVKAMIADGLLRKTILRRENEPGDD